MNKLATLGANNFLSKRDASNLKSDSEHTYYQKNFMGFQSLKKITVATRAKGGGLEQISSDHISETTWNKGLIFCVCSLLIL